MQTRILTAEDASAYWKLRLEALQESPESFATSYEEAVMRENPVQRVADILSSNSAKTFGAFQDGELIGNIIVSFQTMPKLQHKASIFGVYVTPSARGKGIAEAIMQTLISYIEQNSEVEVLDLTVVSTNVPAIRLYEKIGFVKWGLEEKSMKNNDRFIDEWHMNLFIQRR
ncbi:GNAT family N-acetyltransferase [Paenisporosarcina cavernae]|uniref:GNAT family N-acetyltransferase n=1 Tax=Paenisporosarcina cavernae TaxID=2320858 RepID=UPI0013C5353A|nr:GNAT family N-acetyltransferase [Paenisporosarcina cavernae]